ncbi:hypothetical protein MMB17_18525 [Methylobacterium organophilum]|uniref:hypothetical protein n=1 Tax=Methylobacterium organophilum TaxID=410 RepID=UPI001F13943B|nr:hypothetical protein [Methylobacterium organophilum]UMY16658.1 hypothetical protein MMB17_18525 [Methylobacterium organophilum]
MIRRLVPGLLSLLLVVSPLRAESPPATAPGVPAGTGLQPVAIYDSNGNIVNFNGAPGTGSSVVAGSQEQDVRASTTLNAATLNGAVATAINGQATVGYTFTGLTGSGATLTYEQSIDGGTTWTGINAVNRGTGVAESTRNTDGQIALSASGRTNIRVRVSTAGTGTIAVATNVSVREGIVSLGSPLPPGTNQIGSIANAFALETTQQNVATSNAAINAATGAAADAATASGTNTTIIGALRAIRDRLLATVNTAAFGTDGSTARQLRTTTTGVLEPPTAASGKVTVTSTSLSANTSTTIAAANASRIALGVQCASGGVSLSETGAALTGAAVGQGSLFIPSGSGPYFTPPVATLTAVTAYTATAQTCVVTEYLR